MFFNVFFGRAPAFCFVVPPRNSGSGCPLYLLFRPDASGLHKRMPLPSLAQILQRRNNRICSLIGGIIILLTRYVLRQYDKAGTIIMIIEFYSYELKTKNHEHQFVVFCMINIFLRLLKLAIIHIFQELNHTREIGCRVIVLRKVTSVRT